MSDPVNQRVNELLQELKDDMYPEMERLEEEDDDGPFRYYIVDADWLDDLISKVGGDVKPDDEVKRISEDDDEEDEDGDEEDDSDPPPDPRKD